MSHHIINGKTLAETIATIKATADSNGKDHKVGKDALKAIDTIERFERGEIEACSADIASVYRYIICDSMTGKMTDLHSLSTSCQCNSNCQAFSKDKTKICSHCFSFGQLSKYFNQAVKQAIASYFLSMAIWPVSVVPTVYTPSGLFRFESFGDVLPIKDGGYAQVVNYFIFARKNSHLACAVWTKSPAIYSKVLESVEPPANLVFVYSDPFMDGVNEPDAFYSYIQDSFPFIDHIFTVYTDSDSGINCGALHCSNCRRCYRKDTEFLVRELLK